jgi:peptidoglycan hydrolase CwlO-like protein
MTLNPNSDKVERVNYSELPKEPRGGVSGGMKTFIVILLTALVVSYAMISFYAIPKMVTKADFTTNIQSVANLERDDVAKLKSSLADLNNQLVTLQNSVTQQLNTQNQSIEQKISNISGYAKQTDLTNLSNNISKLQNDISTIQSRLDSISTSDSTITALKTQLATAETTISSLKSTVTTLKADVTTLQNTVAGLTGTSGTTTTTTTTSTLVTSTVTGDLFGNILLSYVGIPTSGTSKSFNFTLTNSAGRTIKNIQLMAGFAFMDASKNQINVPTGVTATLSTNGGLTPVWGTAQVSGGTVAFQSAVGTGLFTDLYNFSQGSGSASYQLTLTLTNTGSSDYSTTQYYIYPIMKVVSYQ